MLTTAPVGPSTLVAEDNALLAWTESPAICNASSTVLSSGTLYACRIPWRQQRTISNHYLFVGTAGATLTANQNLVGIYDPTGTRLWVSGDQSTSWTSTGLKTVTTGGVTPPVTAAGYLWLAVLSVGSTTVGLYRTAGIGAGMWNVGLTAATARIGVLTGQTSLPSTITPSNFTTLTTFMPFMAVGS